MSRVLALVILFGIIFIAWFGLTQYKKSYEILPANLPNKIETSGVREWHEFTPRSERFKVSLPTLPQHASENQKDRHYDMYVSEKSNGNLFMISLIDFKAPITAQNHEVVLNSIMEDLLNTNPTNELKSSNSKKFENKNTLNFTIENKEIAINGKAFIDEQTLYVLTYISKLENQDKKEASFFMNSFRLLPSKKSKNGVKSE